MALFPYVESEDLIQESDRTRIEGIKSFVSDGADITTYKIKPSKNASEVTLSITDSDLFYLDWEYEFKIDVDSTNNKIRFSEGGPTLEATISDAEYGLDALAVSIKAAMDTAGSLVYSVEVNDDDQFTIFASGDFSLLPASDGGSSPLYPDIGFSEDQTGAQTYTGSKVETVRKEQTVTIDNGSGEVSKSKEVLVISEKADNLWSDDADLQEHEPDILRFVRRGRNSYKHMHRLAQSEILAYLDKEGYVDVFDRKYTKAAFLDVTEVHTWSKYLTLRLIFDGISNQTDDIFFDKARRYESQEKFHRDRAVLRIDVTQDGTLQLNEFIETKTPTIIRR